MTYTTKAEPRRPLSNRVAGRAIVGIGAAGIVTGTFTIIGFVASPEKRPLFTGLMGGVYGIACLLGPLLGGAFADKVSWRWCFFISLPLGSLAVLITVILFRTPSRSRPIQATLGEKLLQVRALNLSSPLRMSLETFWLYTY